MRLLIPDNPPESAELLRLITQSCEKQDFPVYIVGGYVRDLILGRAVSDFDIVIEGDAIQAGKRLVREYGGKLTSYPPFGTAKWILPEEVTGLNPERGEIDLVSARKEVYPAPAALPVVSLSDMKDDLFRRDFSVNALALRLDGAHKGDLLDLYHGQEDIEKGLIRVLHGRSFEDDPTRMFRAVRFEKRLSFEIEPETLAQLERSLRWIRDVSGPRIAHELRLILKEKECFGMFERLDALGVLRSVHPVLEGCGDPACWFARLTKNDLDSLSRRLQLSASAQKTLWGAAFLEQNPPCGKPSEITLLFEKVPDPSLKIFERIHPEQSGNIRMFREVWHGIKSPIDGRELIARGMTPGPEIAERIQRARCEAIDGN